VQHLRLGENWSLETIWSAFDFGWKLREVIPESWLRDSDRELKRALLDVYGRRCDQLAGQISPNATLARLIAESLGAGDSLISFNYDTIAERVASTRHRLTVGRSTSARVRLVKPHGSASWNLNCKTGDVTSCTVSGEPLLDSIHSRAVCDTIEPMVLGAVPIKSELIQEVQECARSPSVFRVVAEQWSLVVQSIKHADSIYVVGYSFPRDDQYGRFLIQEALRMRPPHRKLHVKYYERMDQCQKTADAIRDTFGNCLDGLEYCGAVRPG
jgi:hypothetical protein